MKNVRLFGMILWLGGLGMLGVLGCNSAPKYLDESDIIPENATLKAITVCAEGPNNSPLENVVANANATLALKVVGHFTTPDGEVTPQLLEGITWKADNTKVELTATSLKGLVESGRLTVSAAYQGKQDSFDVTVLPALTGDGFKAEFFRDAEFKDLAVTRTDPQIYYRWTGRDVPDQAIDGTKPWSARWSGMLNIQTDGEYTFYFLQGEGNDRFFAKDKNDKSQKQSCYAVLLDGQQIIANTGKGNYPWASPKPSAQLKLTKGMHTIEVTCIDASSHPVVAELYWSGPGIKQSLLGGGYIHSQQDQTAKH